MFVFLFFFPDGWNGFGNGVMSLGCTVEGGDERFISFSLTFSKDICG